MRAFVAISPPVEVRDVLGDLQDHLPLGRAVQPENIHLTLAFLGDQPVDLIEDLHHRLLELRPAPFELGIDGLDTFGGREPAVLVARVASDPALSDLRQQVRSAARGAGMELDRTRFRPHLTLMRFRRRLAPHDTERLRRFLGEHGAFTLQRIAIGHFSLIRSTLRPDGPLHEELARYPLEADVQ